MKEREVEVSQRKVINVGGKSFQKVSDLEMTIANDCISDAFWKYSLPLMTLSAAGTQAAISLGHLAPTPSFKLAPSAPKVMVGAAAGFALGQLLWRSYNDCWQR